MHSVHVHDMFNAAVVVAAAVAAADDSESISAAQ